MEQTSIRWPWDGKGKGITLSPRQILIAARHRACAACDVPVTQPGSSNGACEVKYVRTLKEQRGCKCWYFKYVRSIASTCSHGKWPVVPADLLTEGEGR